MILHVTQQDIDNGVREDANSCPIALAFRRTFPHIKRVEVLCDAIYIVNTDYIASNSSRRTIARINPKTQSEFYSFVQEFDGGRDVYPIAIELKRVERPGAR